MRKYKKPGAGFKRRAGICACIAGLVLSAGCGQARVPDVVNVTSLAVTEDGTVTSYLVEDFDKDYYSIKELTTVAMAEASDYNAENGGENGEILISVNKVELLSADNSKVVLTQTFAEAGVYGDYNEELLFVGTVAEAAEAGYLNGITLKNVKDDTLLSTEQLLQDGERKVLVTDAKAVVYAPGKVTHISDGTYNEDGTVDTSACEGVVVILLK